MITKSSFVGKCTIGVARTTIRLWRTTQGVATNNNYDTALSEGVRLLFRGLLLVGDAIVWLSRDCGGCVLAPGPYAVDTKIDKQKPKIKNEIREYRQETCHLLVPLSNTFKTQFTHSLKSFITTNEHPTHPLRYKAHVRQRRRNIVLTGGEMMQRPHHHPVCAGDSVERFEKMKVQQLVTL